MLKRYQVLLPDWLEDNIKLFVEKYDLSFSEVIRAEICSAILATVPKQFPEFKSGITHDEIVKLLKGNPEGHTDREKIHRILSKIYFEARKAVEYRLEKEKALKKK